MQLDHIRRLFKASIGFIPLHRQVRSDLFHAGADEIAETMRDHVHVP